MAQPSYLQFTQLLMSNTPDPLIDATTATGTVVVQGEGGPITAYKGDGEVHALCSVRICRGTDWPPGILPREFHGNGEYAGIREEHPGTPCDAAFGYAFGKHLGKSAD